VTLDHPAAWLSSYSIANGMLALCTCGYLAAVYLMNETKGELRADFRQRAIVAGTATAVMAIMVLLLAWREANWFFNRLLSGRSLAVVALGLLCFVGSAWAVFTRRYLASRVFAIAEITFLLLGWGLAQYSYLVFPDITLHSAAAPLPTIRFLVCSLPFGAILILPSLWLLLVVFKSSGTANASYLPDNTPTPSPEAWRSPKNTSAITAAVAMSRQ
jgi:cytochrome d ubiquinol oxidase subunit II